ncbi:MAG TPA: LacI family DNA-binding transcriptional regulator [Chloroflexia bacterium]|nr:LacI family DNA-binding transcriptional regulator [Chloroflexia bacterium]
MAAQRLQKVTIKDIARMCQVSTQTVSRVLNNRADVAPGTRSAVEKAIAELGYEPSALARSLVQQRSYTLGVITTGLKYSGVSLTLNGITENCEAFNYSLLLKELASPDVTDIVPIIKSLIANHVEGIIFAAPEIGNNVQTVQSQLPVICPPIVFLKSQPSKQHMTIVVDNYNGARQATEHLLKIGRRNIGHISGPMEWLEARQRWQGWADTLKSAGETVLDRHWSMGNWYAQSGEEAFAELIQKYPEMDAVFVSNDQMALGLLHYASTHGIRVPDDLAVVGFDDLPESAYFTPALTTIKHPLRELGMYAVKTLLKLIEEGPEAEPEGILTLQTELVIRDSTQRLEAPAIEEDKAGVPV